MVLIWILGAGGATAEGLSDVPVSEYIRLHVVAADDSPDAQALKLRVRDAVLDVARDLLKDVNDAEEAWRIVNDNLSSLEAAARTVTGDAACQAGMFPFPDRTYGDTLVPAGNYRALRVVIGEGEGHNWWCVLYPNMCFKGSVFEVIEEEAEQSLKEVLSPWEYADVFDSGKVEFRFKFLEYFWEKG
jgi:stage II sporulation protein R